MKRFFWSRAAGVGGLCLCLTLAPQLIVAQPAPPGAPRPSDSGALPRDGQRPPNPGEAPGGGRPNADPVEMLLNNVALQAELKIDAGQLRHLKSIAREFQFRQYELLQQLNEGPEKAKAAQGALKVHMEMGRAMIARVLSRRQLDRLQQIMMQVGGVCLAIRDENVARAISIDPSQMQSIASACQKMRAAEQPMPQGVGPREVCVAMKRAQASYDAVRSEVDAAVATILSDGQVAALHAMEGRPFAMAPPVPPECQW